LNTEKKCVDCDEIPIWLLMSLNCEEFLTVSRFHHDQEVRMSADLHEDWRRVCL